MKTKTYTLNDFVKGIREKKFLDRGRVQCNSLSIGFDFVQLDHQVVQIKVEDEEEWWGHALMEFETDSGVKKFEQFLGIIEHGPKKFTNRRMNEKVLSGEAIDISGCERNADGDYILKEFIEGKDYCNNFHQVWIWSIGKHYETGQILASHGNKFYQNPEYECLFLR